MIAPWEVHNGQQEKTSLGVIQFWKELSGKTIDVLAYFQGSAMADPSLL